MAVILVTNDDGVESRYFLSLVQGLQRNGHHVIGYVPMHDQSGRSMALTLRRNILTKSREDLVQSLDLDVNHPTPSLYSIDGTPCDCVILAIDGYISHNGDPKPELCISGINAGPNLSVDLMTLVLSLLLGRHHCMGFRLLLRVLPNMIQILILVKQ